MTDAAVAWHRTPRPGPLRETPPTEPVPGSDDILRQLSRYVPTEIVAAYTAAAGAIPIDNEPDVHEDYVSAYDLAAVSSPNTATAIGRFAESARFVRHYPEQNPVLRGLLPSITTPALIMSGREDDLVPWSAS
jgi:pimeloyl-ACP methyl ester carboxylesterase